ncbi:MAG: BtpA/SgcQ family protein [Candidatus Njordarchaeia archaeon]
MSNLTYKLGEIFDVKKPIIGVVHLKPLPGSPNFMDDLESNIEFAVSEAKKLEEGGIDGIIVENFWDSPFKKIVRDPLTISAMAIIVKEVVREVSVPVGVNVLRNSAIEAAAIAKNTGAKFIRVNVYVETIVTDSGLVEPAAPRLLDYMASRGIKLGVFADINVKHGVPIAKRETTYVAKDALERGHASALIITGKKTGEPPSVAELIDLRQSGIRPVLIGSGLNVGNINLLKNADGAIVGTYFKKEGRIENEIDVGRVRKLIESVDR